MSRRQAREIALQSLFQIDFSDNSLEDAYNSTVLEFEDNLSKKIPNTSKNFAYELIIGTIKNKESIDEKISTFAKDWTISRMSGIDRNILRLAVYELLYSSETVSPNIPINEAIDLAKKYGSDQSAKFVNGVLDAVIK